jgi:Na+/H+ antiporter NhaA
MFGAVATDIAFALSIIFLDATVVVGGAIFIIAYAITGPNSGCIWFVALIAGEEVVHWDRTPMSLAVGILRGMGEPKVISQIPPLRLHSSSGRQM